MSRLRQAVQGLRSSLAARSTDYTFAERCNRSSKTLPSSLSLDINSSSGGASCRKFLRRGTVRAQVLGCPLEERIENRAPWKSYAERPCCGIGVKAGSGVTLTEIETETVVQTRELSELDVDKECLHPGLQIKEEIQIQHAVEPFEQPVVPLTAIVRSVEQKEAIAHGQDVVDAVELRLVEQEIEESHWTDIETGAVAFEAQQVEAAVGSAEDVEKCTDLLVEIVQEVGLEGGFAEDASSSGNLRGLRHLHVLSVAEVREVLEKARAKDLKVLYVKDSCEWTDYIVIASGRSTRHLRGMADAIVYKVKQRSHNVGPNLYPLVEGREAEQWMTVDLGNIAVHLFLEEARSYYNLEELWGKRRSSPVESTLDRFSR